MEGFGQARPVGGRRNIEFRNFEGFRWAARASTREGLSEPEQHGFCEAIAVLVDRKPRCVSDKGEDAGCGGLHDYARSIF